MTIAPSGPSGGIGGAYYGSGSTFSDARASARLAPAKTHILLGAAGWLAAASAVAAATGQTLDGPTLAAGTLLCAGAALLPDLDHPSGLMADTLGPVTHALARGISRVAGGHRQGTHSLGFSVLAGGVTLAVLRLAPGWVALTLAEFLAAMAARAVEGLRWQTIAGVAGAVTWAASTWAPGMLGQLPAAVMAGCWLHLVGDCSSRRASRRCGHARGVHASR